MKTLKECLQEAKLCNIIEGILDVEDTISNHDDFFKSIANSEKFIESWGVR